MKEGDNLNIESVLITPDIIEECLCESFEALEEGTPSHYKAQETLN
jgi:hypothetical protein